MTNKMISFKYLLTFLLVLMVSAEEATDHDDSVSVSTGEGPLQNYIDDETGEIKSFNPNEQFSVSVVNLSEFRVDIYWDDERYAIYSSESLSPTLLVVVV